MPNAPRMGRRDGVTVVQRGKRIQRGKRMQILYQFTIDFRCDDIIYRKSVAPILKGNNGR